MKKKVMLIGIIIILILLVTFGASVALFNGVRIGSKESSVKVGDLTFKYTEITGIGNGISLEDADAISDAEGKGLTTWFDFKIDANLVNSDMIYEVSVEPTSETTINLDGIKIYLTEVVDDEEVDINSNYNGLGKVKVITDYDNGVIYQERILKNTKNYEKNFRVRIWISEDVDIYTDGYMGKKGAFKINVNAKSDISMVDASIPVPEITGGTGLGKVYEPQTIRIANNPVIGGVAYYEYYITSDETDTPSENTIPTGTTQDAVLIDQKNLKYIYYRIVTLDDSRSLWSNPQVVNYGSLCEYDEGYVWNFAYTGAVQKFEIPCDGNYKLEAWGAQGGKSGGKGGYSQGNISVDDTNKIYICVGKAGATNGTNAYNGGGAGNGGGYAGDGGGATHIALNSNRGVLSNYEGYLNEVLLVAGGGGGNSEYGNPGGTGGGTNGSNGAGGFRGTGGSQTAGGTGPGLSGTFGKGGNAETLRSCNSTRYYGGGGGGGLYGGGGGGYTCKSSSSASGAGGGGSGYIGNVTNGSTSNGVQSGNGMVRITYLGD